MGITGFGLCGSMAGRGVIGFDCKFEELEFCLIASAIWGMSGGGFSLVGCGGGGFWLRDGATNGRVTGTRAVGMWWVWLDKADLDRTVEDELWGGTDIVSGTFLWEKGEWRTGRDWISVVARDRDDLCNPRVAVLLSAMPKERRDLYIIIRLTSVVLSLI
jgi:hypothetical protein